MKFVSLVSIARVLRKRRCWAFCAAMATDRPVTDGPNLRILRDAAGG